MKNIKRIVLTGGPASGKSTFMTLAVNHFEKKGYRVLIDNEAATDLITGGISPASMGMYQFQKYVIGLQLKKEELFDMAANEINGDNVIIFYDRAILDDKGYVTDEEFAEILSDFDVTEQELIDRYDLVVHMTTTAKNKADDFSNENNAARYEDVDEAIRMDDMVLESWSVHPHHYIVEGEDDFSQKLNNALDTVEKFLETKK